MKLTELNKKRIAHLDGINKVRSIKNFAAMDDEKKLQLFNKLRRLEMNARRAALSFSTRERYTAAAAALLDKYEKKLIEFFDDSDAVTVNRDPRGPALKIETTPAEAYAADPVVIDWGNNIIIAPDPSEVAKIVLK